MLQLSFEFPDPARRPEPRAPLTAQALDRAYDRASQLSRELSARLDQRVRLVLTDNRSSMMSAREKAGRLEVRLHHMFLEADQPVIDALVRYLGDGHRASAKKIDAFIERNQSHVLASAERRTTLRTAGDHFDLHEIAGDLARRYFSGPFDAKITWGKRAQPKRRQRSLQLGTYLPDEGLIRIHPVLDQPWVPRFFVEAVIFHEMLHHDMPAVVHNGRHRYHTAAFRKRERAFEHHEAALRWEEENLWRLLRGK